MNALAGATAHPVDVPAQPPAPCPFNTAPYAQGFARMGGVEMSPSGRLAILRRPIGGTPFEDGISPFPYLWLAGPEDEESLVQNFRHLVTLTVIAQPGYVPAARAGTARLFKHHFAFDPRLPAPPLSARARRRLARCAEVARFEEVTGFAERMAMTGLYASLVERRGLAGGFFDMDAAHFASIARLDCARFFRVVRDGATAAMACAVVFGGMLQVLHNCTSREGLRWNASYLLMHGLQAYAAAHDIRMLTGGLPQGSPDGLRAFKSRWTNAFEPVYMLRIVNDPVLFARLSAGRADADFFPAYRAP